MQYEERIQQGLCGLCGERQLANKTECEECAEVRRKRQRDEYKCRTYHKNRREDRIKNGFCDRCGRCPPLDFMKSCRACLDKQKAHNTKIKNQVFEAYGGFSCVCCGESMREFLTLDHVNNDGAEHRRQLGRKGSGKALYTWIIEQNFPPLFQVLCANCNFGKKMNGGVCPHKNKHGTTRIH